MTKRRALTDDYVNNLQRPPKGGRYEIPDPGAPRLWLRVGRTNIVFVVIARLGGASNATRLQLGTYDEMSLDEARAEAKRLNAIIDLGLDPREEDRRNALEEERAAVESAMLAQATFEEAFEKYLAYMPGREHNRSAMKQIPGLRRELLDPERNPWMKTPLSKVKAKEVAKLIAAVRDRPAPTSAYNLYRDVKTFFNWAFAAERRDDYDLETNIMDGLPAKDLRLRPRKRKRFLTEDEVGAYVRAAAATPYPYGPFFTLMILTGQRENEVAGMRRSEIDIGGRLWTIPEWRYKTGRIHLVPLTDLIAEVLAALLRALPHGHGDCLFSIDHGQTPIKDFSKPVLTFRKKVVSELREANPGAVMASWELEDTRRTVRTHLARLKVAREVGRALLGHAKENLDAVYDQYEYLEERHDALTLWGSAILPAAAAKKQHGNDRSRARGR